MLDVNYIRENVEKVKKGVADKGYPDYLVEKTLGVDEKRREILKE